MPPVIEYNLQNTQRALLEAAWGARQELAGSIWERMAPSGPREEQTAVLPQGPSRCLSLDAAR